MESLELDKEKISAAISKIARFDYKTVSIEEIEHILFDLFRGFRTSIPKYPAGLFVYRGRICSKPIFLKELGYPDNKFVTKYGRANDIGQSMFYGSIGKGVPLFELSASLGDKIALSLWRTKTELQLNHVGFTVETVNQLRSSRDMNQAVEHLNHMKVFGDLNELVYNYLASCFTRIVREGEESNYKLSVAIANKLMMGDMLPGIVYPTIKMDANSDNVALKPDYVDKNMEFVSVEYVVVTSINGGKYTFDILDSAIDIDSEKKLQWTGRMLGWNLGPGRGMHLNTEASDWRARNEDGLLVMPKPVGPLLENLTEIQRKHLDAYKDIVTNCKEVDVETQVGKVRVKIYMHLDFTARTKFISVYIPVCNSGMAIAIAFLEKYYEFISLDGFEIKEYNEITGETLIGGVLQDIREIHFYSEVYLDQNILKSRKGSQFKIVVTSKPGTVQSFQYFFRPKE